jgi:hypothetical protein
MYKLKQKQRWISKRKWEYNIKKDIAEIGWYVWSGITWFSSDSSEVSDEYSCFLKDRTLSCFLSDRRLALLVA